MRNIIKNLMMSLLFVIGLFLMIGTPGCGSDEGNKTCVWDSSTWDNCSWDD